MSATLIQQTIVPDDCFLYQHTHTRTIICATHMEKRAKRHVEYIKKWSEKYHPKKCSRQKNRSHMKKRCILKPKSVKKVMWFFKNIDGVSPLSTCVGIREIFRSSSTNNVTSTTYSEWHRLKNSSWVCATSRGLPWEDIVIFIETFSIVYLHLHTVLHPLILPHRE